MPTKKITICENHLPELFEALKRGDLQEIKEIEHELSPQELCVACTYTYRVKGTTKEFFEQLLQEKSSLAGSEMVIHKLHTDGIAFWILRISILLTIVAGIFFVVSLIKQFFNINFYQNGFSFSILEITLIYIISLIIFLWIDDTFFD